MKKELAKILIDISKLIFAGVILAGIMRQDIPLWKLITFGLAVMFMTMGTGLLLTWWTEKEANKNVKKTIKIK